MRSYNVQIKFRFAPEFPLDKEAERIYQTLAADELVERVEGYKINDMLQPELRLEFVLVVVPDQFDDGNAQAYYQAHAIFEELMYSLDVVPIGFGLELLKATDPSYEDALAAVEGVLAQQ